MTEEAFMIEIPRDCAEAVVDAINCFAFAAEGDFATVMNVYMPKAGPDMRASNEWMLHLAGLAETHADILRQHIADANKRDPDLQDALHSFKMADKYGVPEEEDA